MNHAIEKVCEIADALPQVDQNCLRWSHIEDVARYYGSGEIHVSDIALALRYLMVTEALDDLIADYPKGDA